MTKGMKTISCVERCFNKLVKVRHIGVLFMFLACFLYSVGAILAKVVSTGAIQIVIIRVGFKVLIISPILLKNGPTSLDKFASPNKTTVFLILRGLAGSGAALFIYTAIKYASPGLVISVTFLDVVMLPFLSRVLLKESLTPLDLLFAAMSFTGVLLIAKPPFLFTTFERDHGSFLGILCAVLGALSTSFSSLLLRKIGPSINPLVPTLYYGLVGVAMCFVIICITGEFVFACLYEVGMLFLIGVCGVSGVIFFTLALRTERPSTVSVINTAQIVFVTLAQILFLDDIPSTLDILGSALIFSTSICIGIRKIANDRKNSA